HEMGKTSFYQDMRRSGALRSTLVSLDRKTMRESLMKSLERSERGRWKDIAKSLVTNQFYLLQEFAQAGEMGTRLGAARRAFRKETAQGTPRKTALERAGFEFREITTDFSLQGSSDLLKTYHSITAFQNARIQGIDRFARAMKDNPVRTTIKAVASVTIPTIVAALHNMTDPEYADKPQWATWRYDCRHRW
ncbi:MAG: hypothetical protein IIC50_23260, partial [Planctomycetes bacterium]|nr:hypothetical protein [Planctomycetota bacterium]